MMPAARATSKRPVKTVGRNDRRLPKSPSGWKRIISSPKFSEQQFTNQAAILTDELVDAERGSYIFSCCTSSSDSPEFLHSAGKWSSSFRFRSRHNRNCRWQSKDRIKRCSSRQNHPPWGGVSNNFVLHSNDFRSLNVARPEFKIHDEREFCFVSYELTAPWMLISKMTEVELT